MNELIKAVIWRSINQQVNVLFKSMLLNFTKVQQSIYKSRQVINVPEVWDS